LCTKQGVEVELSDQGVLEQLNLLEDKKFVEVVGHAKRVTDLTTYSRTENYRRYGRPSAYNCQPYNSYSQIINQSKRKTSNVQNLIHT
jgi:hypothetical protein